MCLYLYFYCGGRSLQAMETDEMPNDAAFHLGLYCLSKTAARGASYNITKTNRGAPDILVK